MPEIVRVSFPMPKLNVINVESVESLNDRCYTKPMRLPLRLEQQLLVNEYP